ncbi:TIGR02611 family protein [Microbacteriaceae bacterium]|nr:TIGR02611 family protein [Candidatus Saccharibacteria bacterium]
MGTIKKNTKRIVVGFAGWLVILVGVVLIPFPGPGWVIVFIGFSILASEFDWAKDVKQWVESKYEAWRRWFMLQRFWIKLAFGILTFLTASIVVWLVNGYGFIDTVFHLNLDWLHSPFFRSS